MGLLYRGQGYSDISLNNPGRTLVHSAHIWKKDTERLFFSLMERFCLSFVGCWRYSYDILSPKEADNQWHVPCITFEAVTARKIQKSSADGRKLSKSTACYTRTMPMFSCSQASHYHCCHSRTLKIVITHSKTCTNIFQIRNTSNAFHN